MPEQLAENLYTIPVPLPGNPLKNLNAYVITGQRSLLIDTGFRQEPCRKALEEGLRALGVDRDRMDIFLTHLHSDHTGLAPELRGRDTQIFVGDRDLRYLPGQTVGYSWAAADDRFAAEGFPRDLLKILTERNPAKSLSPIPYQGYIPVQDGTEFRYGGHCFRAILTPGHTPGHLCLWEAETGICILGDHVLFDITPNITRWHGYEDSLGDYLASLQRIRALPVTLPLPAHRAVQGNFSGRCEELIRHHETRCGEVLSILADGEAHTAWFVASRMTWSIRCNSWADFPTPQKWFAVGEAMAHLDHLIALGQVTREKQGELFFYRASACG